MANEIIKQKADEAHVKLWELARRMGIADTTLSKKLRREFCPEDQKRALDLIEEIANSKEGA